MNLSILTKPERILVALLKAALNQTAVDDVKWDSVTEAEWDECLTVAARHGVVALAWDGIGLQPGGHRLLKDMIFSWGLTVEQCEHKYEKQCRAANMLEEEYSRHGIAMVQLKGVGFSTYYPVPEHREGGDVDVFTWSADKNRLSDQEANLLADELMKRKGIDVDTDHTPKHSNFWFEDVPVENHRTLLNVYNGGIAVPMNQLLLDLLKPQTAELCLGKYRVSVPPAPFNALFIGFHAAQHFGSGFCLHHLFDWACLLKRHGWCLPAEVKDKRLLRFLCAITHLCYQLFGTTVSVEADADTVACVFKEMMHPLYPHKYKIREKNKMMILYRKTSRFLYHYRTSRVVFNVSLSVMIFQWIISRIKNPRPLFAT